MKRLFLMFALLAVAAIANEHIDVKQFGAKGDGVTDDTAAIQAALNAAGKQRLSGQADGLYFNAQPAVFFPNGNYVISDVLKPASELILGEGGAYIVQKDKSKDIMFFNYLWEGSVEGVNFVGGRNQVSIGNGNIDMGHVTISKCKFVRAGGVAAETRLGSNSTFFIIRDCVFQYCEQAVISNCDKTTIADCWIETSPKMANKAVIVNAHGIMSVDRMLGVPLVESAGQRWIDNVKGTVFCNECRFGGEGGGFTPVWNFSKFNPIPGTGASVILRNCEVNAQGNYRAMAAVYCIEVPNIISVENCTLCGVPAIMLADSLDMSHYFDTANPGALSYRVDNCTGPDSKKLPPALVKPKMLGKVFVPGQIPMGEAKKLLKNILKNLPPSIVPEDGKACYVPDKKLWTVDALMDATSEKNSERIVMGHKDGRTVLMQRCNGQGWPHVEIRGMEVDLDKFPVLEIRYSNPEDTPLDTSVKLVDEDGGELYQLSGQNGGNDLRFDLRKQKLAGKKRLALRIYYLGLRYIAPKSNSEPYTMEHAAPGNYIILDKVRFAEP